MTRFLSICAWVTLVLSIAASNAHGQARGFWQRAGAKAGIKEKTALFRIRDVPVSDRRLGKLPVRRLTVEIAPLSSLPRGVRAELKRLFTRSINGTLPLSPSTPAKVQARGGAGIADPKRWGGPREIRFAGNKVIVTYSPAPTDRGTPATGDRLHGARILRALIGDGLIDPHRVEFPERANKVLARYVITLAGDTALIRATGGVRHQLGRALGPAAGRAIIGGMRRAVYRFDPAARLAGKLLPPDPRTTQRSRQTQVRDAWFERVRALLPVKRAQRP